MASLNDLLRVPVTFKDSVSGDMVNVFWMTVEAAGTGGDTGLLADMNEHIAYLYTPVKGDISNNVTGYQFTIIDKTSGAISGPTAFDPAWTGGSGSTPLPTGVCMLVLGRTGVSRRVARKYLPVFGEPAFDGVGFTTTAVSHATTFGDHWRGTGGPYTNGWSFKGVEVHGTPPVILTIESIVALSVPAYQRRRRAGRGS